MLKHKCISNAHFQMVKIKKNPKKPAIFIFVDKGGFPFKFQKTLFFQKITGHWFILKMCFNLIRDLTVLPSLSF